MIVICKQFLIYAPDIDAERIYQNYLQREREDYDKALLPVKCS